MTAKLQISLSNNWTSFFLKNCVFPKFELLNLVKNWHLWYFISSCLASVVCWWCVQLMCPWCFRHFIHSHLMSVVCHRCFGQSVTQHIGWGVIKDWIHYLTLSDNENDMFHSLSSVVLMYVVVQTQMEASFSLP